MAILTTIYLETISVSNKFIMVAIFSGIGLPLISEFASKVGLTSLVKRLAKLMAKYRSVSVWIRTNQKSDLTFLK